MIQLFAFEATHILEWLDVYLQDAKRKIKTGGMASRITDEDNLDLLKDLGSAKEFCKKCELGNSQARLENFSYKLSHEKLLNTVIESEIDGLITSLREELNIRYCAFIPCRKLEFFERNFLLEWKFGRLFQKPRAKSKMPETVWQRICTRQRFFI
jgi:hypothetical protein